MYSARIPSHLVKEYAAAETVQQARLNLRACLVPKPGRRSAASAILRELS
jgi:hypothetical protein